MRKSSIAANRLCVSRPLLIGVNNKKHNRSAFSVFGEAVTIFVFVGSIKRLLPKNLGCWAVNPLGPGSIPKSRRELISLYASTFTNSSIDVLLKKQYARVLAGRRPDVRGILGSGCNGAVTSQSPRQYRVNPNRPRQAKSTPPGPSLRYVRRYPGGPATWTASVPLASTFLWRHRHSALRHP
jgi:hypothetical protein